MSHYFKSSIFCVPVLVKTALMIGTIRCLCGQSTIETGFEEYPIGATLPFVTQILSHFEPQVADSMTASIPPFEGNKFLYASGITWLKSPDGLPIESFTLHAFMPPQGNTVRFSIGSQIIQPSTSWQTIQAFYDSPVQAIPIWGLDAETNPYVYGIDAVQFVTIPEPKTFRLFPTGLAAIALRPLLRGPKPTRA
jgi:hypothetical protein